MRDTWLSEENTGDQHRKKIARSKEGGCDVQRQELALGGKTKVSASPKERRACALKKEPKKGGGGGVVGEREEGDTLPCRGRELRDD